MDARRGALALSLALLMLGLSPSASGVATFTPTRFDDPPPGNCDPGDCSLREAIIAANSLAGPDTIVLAAGTYTLSIPGTGEDVAADGDLDITDDLTISGEGQGVTIVNGNGAATGERVVHVDPLAGGAGPVVSLSAMTITGGTGSLGLGVLSENEARVSVGEVTVTGNTGVLNGGGILNEDDAVMTIAHSTVSDNTLGGSFGPGILNRGQASLTILRSTISGNAAGGSFGGGVHNRDDATLEVQDSSISGNSSGGLGGGLFLQNQSVSHLTNVTISGNTAETNGGGLFIQNDATVTVESATISANRADSDGDTTGDGGGIFVYPTSFGGLVTLHNSIVAGNFDPNSEPDCSGPIASAGNNLVSIVSAGCAFTPAAGDQTGTAAAPLDPELGSLAANGGPTQTHALLPGSPAVNAGGSGGPLADQRGAPRLGAPDIGAYERVLCRGRLVNVVGTASNDVLVGTTAADGILGLPGKDKLKGKAGPDGLCGGPGKDILRGGGAKDRLDGGPGKDLCIGQGAKDKARACEKERGIP